MLRNRTLWIIIAVIILIALGFWGNRQGWFGGKSSSKDWQAVFLTNGQVYFGHIVGPAEGQYLTFKDIYYLQVQKAIQPKSEDSAEPKVQLVKLGNELHAPKDEMKINRDQVLFIESLKDDSRVVNSIEKFIKEGPEKPESSPTATPTETKK